MAITEAQKAIYENLRQAVRDDSLALLECTDRATQEAVPALCVVQVVESEVEGEENEYEFYPLAKLFTTDPYVELLPPTDDNT
tara:strand:- start:235 stop:483 length:249 start_codon:yes stop_codon:yes gene_type:complete